MRIACSRRIEPVHVCELTAARDPVLARGEDGGVVRVLRILSTRRQLALLDDAQPPRVNSHRATRIGADLLRRRESRGGDVARHPRTLWQHDDAGSLCLALRHRPLHEPRRERVRLLARGKCQPHKS